jgi:hypothetical protein
LPRRFLVVINPIGVIALIHGDIVGDAQSPHATWESGSPDVAVAAMPAGLPGARGA